MFPNPQDALLLPSRANLEHYRKLAKQLLKAGKAGSLRSGVPMEEFARSKFSGNCTLSGAQFVIARSHGFANWPKFAKHLEGLAKKSQISSFEAAADAIVEGDIATLKRLLREHPKLIRARSTRAHGATLLHYVAANGVENYRQRTPRNIVEITELLLDAGAEIDATADVYGRGCTALDLAATSVHPERAGVQEALLQKLFDHGADAALRSAGHGQSLVTACLANGRSEAARFLASRGARLDLAGAAGIGGIDAVRRLMEDATTDQTNEAFRYACGYAHNDVLELLWKKGVDLSAHSGDGQTPLHMAVIGGHLETVTLLLRHNPPLEAANIYGGTVLGQALWSAAHGGDPEVYVAILEALIRAGARVPALHIPVNETVDAWLAKHGSQAERSWNWYGEEPSEANVT